MNEGPAARGLERALACRRCENPDPPEAWEQKGINGVFLIKALASEPQRRQRIDTRSPPRREIARCQGHENK